MTFFVMFQSSATVTSSQIGAPRPTFPAAASVAPGSVAGASSNSATITGAPTIKKPESTSGLTSKLVHPDEDVSLVSFYFLYMDTCFRSH